MKNLNGKQLLAIVYLAIVGISIFRISVHPLNYTTPDSIAYLNQADFIKEQWRSAESATEFHKVKGTFTTWPLAYPFSIALVSALTQTSSLVASKIVNFIFLGLCFLLLYKFFDDKAWFASLPFLSYGSLEVIAETWSELPFLFFVLLLCYLLVNERKRTTWQLTLALTSTLIMLYLFRYVGVIFFFALGILLIRHLLSKEYRLATSYFISLFLASCFVLWYFYENKSISGFYSGMPRLETGHKGIGGFLIEFLQGLFNEFAIARNYFFRGSIDWLFIMLLGGQIFLTGILIRERDFINRPLKMQLEAKALLLLGVSYLIGITAFKIFISIDDFDFRILFPFSTPIWIALFAWVADARQAAFYEKHAKWIVAFMILSLVVNLPKTFILESLGIL